MRGFSIIACAAALFGGTAPAVAQQKTPNPPKTAAPDDECTSTGEGRIECRKIFERGFGGRLDSAMMKRAALGLQLSPTGTPRDTLGVFVSSVTPKGPAENAGIIEGDRIVSINGVDLRVAPGDIEDGYASGLPSHRLQREVAKLTPGSKASIRVYSGGRIRDVEVTAGRASELMRSRGFINFGDGPGSSFIYHDGMEMPGMPPMDRMRMMEMMPEMQKIREMMPEMRRMELRDLPLLRRHEEGLFSPRRTYRIRHPGAEWNVAPRRAKVDAEKKAKLRADSLKKTK